MPFDELNILKAKIEAVKTQDPERLKRDKGYYIDEVTDFFVLAYVYGTQAAQEQLDKEIMPDITEMEAVINEKFDGKDYKDRLTEYFESGTEADINRVLETDMHRIYNAALFTGAKKVGATMKTWNTMLDNRVRDTHQYLEGVTIPLEAEFYSYLGNKTLYPGQWGAAEEDCGCRCWLTFS